MPFQNLWKWWLDKFNNLIERSDWCTNTEHTLQKKVANKKTHLMWLIQIEEIKYYNWIIKEFISIKIRVWVCLGDIQDNRYIRKWVRNQILDREHLRQKHWQRSWPPSQSSRLGCKSVLDNLPISESKIYHVLIVKKIFFL